MTFKELRSLLSKSKVYSELYKNIKNKSYISEEAIISEEAEKLKKEYLYIFEKTHLPEFAQYVYFLQKCILRRYLSFEETVEMLRMIQKENGLQVFELLPFIAEKELLSNAKKETIEEAIQFLSLK